MLRALFVRLFFRFQQFVYRLRIRHFQRLGLPTVRDELSAARLSLPDAPLSLRQPRALPTDEGAYFEAATPSLDWLAQRDVPPLRLTSTLALPRPLLELSILRPEIWRLERPGHLVDRTPRLPVDLGRARPLYFGVDDETTLIERTAPPPLAQPALLRDRTPIAEPQRLAGPLPTGVVDPEAFGLSPDATPATETQPLVPLKPLGMARARASFLFRFTDARSTERMLASEFHTPSETLEERLAAWFVPSNLGAGEPVEGEVDSELASHLDEVREQFQLRRGIGRAEMDESELGELEPLAGFAGGAIRVYTGLEFENLQPEPVETLRMRLENPPVDMTPSIEAPSDAMKSLIQALAEFPPDGAPPPVPLLGER